MNNTQFGSGTGPIFLTDVGCTAEDNNLLSCTSPVFVHSCTHEKDVGIQCPGK